MQIPDHDMTDGDTGLARVARGVWHLPRLALVGLVRVYQVTLSPLLGPSCRYTPTCSQYAVLALRRYGAVRGTILAVWRVLRCQPWGGHGYDPPRWFTDVDVPAAEPHDLRSGEPLPAEPLSDTPSSPSTHAHP